MSTVHSRFKYSVTCRTEDLAVVYCLRALCDFVLKGQKSQIGWGGTGETEWVSNNRCVTFRFPDPQYRQEFLSEANRLLKGGWSLVATNDNDPAKPRPS